jgi:hypothetical protein
VLRSLSSDLCAASSVRIIQVGIPNAFVGQSLRLYRAECACTRIGVDASIRISHAFSAAIVQPESSNQDRS